MTSQPRWPAGAPDDEHGHGQGGRFAPVGTPGTGGWLRQIGARLDRGWANDERSRLELHGFAMVAAHAGAPADGASIHWLSGGETAHVSRWDLPDGRSVIKKTFHQDEDLYDDDPNSWLWEDDEESPVDGAGRYVDPTDEQLDQVQAEVKSARVAEVMGARVPPAMEDPHDPASVWMGYVDGAAPYEVQGDARFRPTGDSAWRLGLLDLLIDNEDRNDSNNWVYSNGEYVGIDHGGADLFHHAPAAPEQLRDLGVPLDNPFIRLYYKRLKWTDGQPDVELADLPWHPEDLDEIGRRLQALERQGEFDIGEVPYMLAVLRILRPHAKGTRRLIPG